ncbi:MAG TPA: translation initiation factor IF-2 [Acidimicrobiia bacterium]|nr:translation initiation factor IF-2 [Acidimicrobiia bacterium]
MATKKIRIYELARELGVENQVVLDLADELKIGVKSHSSSIEDPMADRVRRLADSRGLRRAEPEPVAPEPTPPPRPEPAPAAPPTPAPAPEPRPAAPHRVVRSTGGIPEPPPIPRPVRPTTGVPEPAPSLPRDPIGARPAAGPAPTPELRSPTGKPIPPPPGARRTPPPPGPRVFTPSSGAPPRGGGDRAPGAGAPSRPRFGGGGGFPGRGGPGGGPGGPGGRGGPPGRGRSGPQGQRPRRKKRRRRDFEDLGPASPTALTPIDAPVPEGEIVVPRGGTIQELAPKLNRNTADLVRLLFDAGEMVTGTQTLADEMIELIAETLGAEVLIVEPGQEQELELQALLGDEEEDDEALLEPRPPIVTVMGHVDHGKTTLLDAIRATNVVAGEAGGITQHIGAYQADRNGRRITFIDTPGHEAFTAMRARGAQATDIVVLVVAADDGVMPQTVEAISHARVAEVPILAAITKVDREDANPERVRQQLVEQGLVPEEWGGDTIVVEVAAPAGRGVDDLLEAILLVADVEELTANPKAPARAFVLESNLEQGRGTVVTALVERGTLRVTEPVVAGSGWGRVRAMFDDRGQTVKEAVPSMPVEVLGLDDVPFAGDELRVAPDEKTARTVAEARGRRRRVAGMAHPMTLAGGARLEDIFAMVQRGEVATLNLVLKADVQGSVEALTDALRKLDQDHEEVRLSFVHRAVGGITESDVNLAAVSNATVIGFNVRPDRKARELAESEHVELRLYEVIYQVLEDVTAALVGLLQPEFEEVVTGDAEVREVFSVPRVGKVAGCYVRNGTVTRGSRVRFLRDGVVIWNGTITSLRRFKDDVREVQAGYECGIGLSDFQDLKAGDVIETYELKELERALR